ncbi:hypothetical protein NNO04_19930 [Citrobacter sp. Awk 4]|uniref:putative T6SS immunity periplasmic lipoprotein n=1 Tax=Citrobacter sp. Awk 4 TaxID=2963955 RepID=UPI0023026FD2|nr:putative T6SS immunity periplasmic lipoprotein [Citrobacter sp. Awk 4]MDA8480955.1 hypothetical protein [Citrobacter sp. Awk 4]
MLKKLVIIPAMLILAGCPSSNHEGAEIGLSRWINIDQERVCYSLDKNDVLTTYNLSSNEDNYKLIIASDTRRPVTLSYPDTCFNLKLNKGYQYSTLYKINGKQYHYEFFIDNNFNVVGK